MIDPRDPYEFASPPSSCSFECPNDKCAENTTPYACQNLLPWADIPHTSTCAWDGVTVPSPTPGQCSASAPTGEALKYAGIDPNDASVLVMPDGRRLTPAGADWVFPDPRSMTSNVIAIPGTPFVVTVDTGYGAHLVRTVDTTLIGSGDPAIDVEPFNNPEALNQGIAFSPPDRLFVAAAGGRVMTVAIDTATGQLTRDDTRAILLPPSPKSPGGAYYASGVALSDDQTKLYVTGVDDSRLLVADVTHNGPSYGTIVGSVDLGGSETYAVYTDPHEVPTRFAYVAMWGSRAVKEVDVSIPSAPVVTRTFQVDKDPQGITFLDGRWMIVGNDLGDTFTRVDRMTGDVTAIPVDMATMLRGVEPSCLLFDETSSRLFVTQAGINAIGAYDIDMNVSPPTITPAGRLPAQWWPSGLAKAQDGSLIAVSLLARGTGPRQPDEEYELLHGGIQRIPAPTAMELAAGESVVAANNAVAARPGYPQVNCPPGADDFPIPETNTGAPSKAIDQVILIVRENKTFDGIFGDFSGVNGEPNHTIAPAAQMDSIWPNIRLLAKTFAHSDNFYTSAFISTQGHLWTTHGRTVDFNEREWPVTGYGRGLRGDSDSGGVIDVGRPDEGSLFDWLGKNNVLYEVMGEIVGLPTFIPPNTDPVDNGYPGGFIQSIGYPDNEKACYVAGRARVRCDLPKFVYMTLPNDHTQGLGSSTPSPETMFAVNDEATGILVEGISKSPLWPKSLVIVIEDDPAQGGDHVDYHRTILVMASPWLKRGYVSTTHVDVASVHKLIAHIYAIPYPNVQVQNAPLPLDMFTSTPDYGTYTHVPRSIPLACGSGVTGAEEKLTKSWDWDDIDQQPGLGGQIHRWLREAQYHELPPDIEADIALRRAAEIQKKIDRQNRRAAAPKAAPIQRDLDDDDD